MCPCNHNTQEATAVQLLWVPGQPGINTKMFYLNKGNKWVKREQSSLPRNLRIACEWDGLGTGAQIWSSKGMGTFCKGNIRAEQSLESLRERQPQDCWVKRGNGAAANWPVFPVREALWGRWGCPAHSRAPAYVTQRHHKINTEWIHLSSLNFSYLSTQAEIHLLLGMEKES